MADPEDDPRVIGMRAVQRRSRRRITEREDALNESDVLRVERDRYREALQEIAQRSPFGTSSEAGVIAIAREALDG